MNNKSDKEPRQTPEQQQGNEKISKIDAVRRARIKHGLARQSIDDLFPQIRNDFYNY